MNFLIWISLCGLSLNLTASCTSKLTKSQEEILNRPAIKAVFFAIEHCKDEVFINQLFMRSIQGIEDRVFVHQIDQQIKKMYSTKSVRVLEMKEKINSGATPAAKRAKLQKSLESLLQENTIDE